MSRWISPKDFSPMDFLPFNEMEKHTVVPDIIPTAPIGLLKVGYCRNFIEVDSQTVLYPAQVEKEPSVDWEADSTCFYTLCMINADYPSQRPKIKKPKMRERLLWLVVNIPGNDMLYGETLAAFSTAKPPDGTGLPKYVYLAYLQPEKLDFSDEPISHDQSEYERGNFSIARFSEKYKFGPPIAGNLHLTELDYCN